jgi:protein TonB
MFNWVERVERIGNLNYPEIARTKGLSGRLLLTVGINKNGSIANVDLRHSSGVPALDQAAQNIVRLAAPFDPLKGELRERTDILYITRTWEFDSEAGLTSE